MTRGSNSELLIVGAGPTGLTAAVELARRGVIPRVIDRKKSASTLSRAVGINSMTLHLLSDSGVTDRLIDAGIRVRKGIFHANETAAFEIDLSLSPKPYDFLLALPQDATEQILIKRFEEFGGVIEYGNELVGLTQSEAGVTASVATGGSEKEMDVGCVFGADGLRSSVRAAAGIRYEGKVVEDEWSIVDFESESWPHRNELCLFLYPGGRVCLVVPIADGRYRGVSDRPNGIENLPSGLKVDRVRRTGKFEIWIKKASTMQDRSVYIGGDAAHCHSPVGGRGMNLGIADACEFAERFILKELNGYSASRREEASSTIRLTERGRFLATRSIPGKFLVMKYLIPVLLRSKRLHKSLVRSVLDVPT